MELLVLKGGEGGTLCLGWVEGGTPPCLGGGDGGNPCLGRSEGGTPCHSLS